MCRWQRYNCLGFINAEFFTFDLVSIHTLILYKGTSSKKVKVFISFHFIYAIFQEN
jgi:hypothetical protein